MGDPAFRFDRAQGLQILKFPKGFERQYDNHLKLVRHLQQVNVYPRLDLAAYVAKSPNATLARIIALTGSSSEVGKLNRVFYDPKAEAFVATEFRNDWNAISPASSLSNVAAPGCTVDVNGLERDLRAIEEEIAAQNYERAGVD